MQRGLLVFESICWLLRICRQSHGPLTVSLNTKRQTEK